MMKGAKVCERESGDQEEVQKDSTTEGGWRDVFDQFIYSDGPGDNIYVYG